MDNDLLYNTQSFGQKLKEAREKAGFDLNTLSRRLRIRADILQSIENSDFKNMPATGFAKNMIRTYARTVGLNQNEISNQYLAEYDAYLRRGERSSEGSSSAGATSRSNRSGSRTRTTRSSWTDGSTRTGRPTRDADGYQAENENPDIVGDYTQDQPRTANPRYASRMSGYGSSRRSQEAVSAQSGRGLVSSEYPAPAATSDYQNETEQSNYVNRARRTSRTSASENRRSTLSSRYSSRSDASSSAREARQSRRNGSSSRTRRDSHSDSMRSSRRNGRSTVSMSSTYSLGKKPGINMPALDSQKLLMIAIAAIVLVLVIVIATLLIGKGNNHEEDVPTMPISGLTDTSNKEDTTTTTEPAKATKATIAVTVEKDSQSWCIVTIDDSQDFEGIIEGGETKTWDVTGKFEFQTANSDPVKLTVDGAEQTLTADESTGYYTFEYEFKAS